MPRSGPRRSVRATAGGHRARTARLSVPSKHPKRGDAASTRLVGCSSGVGALAPAGARTRLWAPLGREPSSLHQRSGRWYQPSSPPLPFTQFSMQGSDWIFFFFFFPPLSGIGFHFLHSQCLCLRRDAAEGTHLRGEGTGLGGE